MDKDFEDAVIKAINKGHNDQKAVAKYLRSRGFKFSAARLRLAWRAVWCTLDHATAPALPLPEPEDIPAPVKPLIGGRIQAPDTYRPSLQGTRFVFTCAQNNTEVHPDFWSALQTFCAHNDAQLGVAKISYNKSGWQNHGGISKNKSVGLEDEGLWYDPRITPFEVYQQVKVADGLLFCGELDILPTAVYPLNGLDNYTGHHSAIVPHTKMQMRSLATMKGEDAKLLYSTGACTMRNYIQRKSGQIAEYQHVYGALYVEVDHDGTWYVRQLNADDDGIFYDLDTAYGPGWTEPASNFGRPFITLGDIHVEKLDYEAFEGASNMLHFLNPEYIFVHDLIDFEARNHHNKKDLHFLVEQQFIRNPSVREGITMGAKFMVNLSRDFPDTQVVSVRSNHDEALGRWLREPCEDAVNLPYWHYLNYRYLTGLQNGEKLDVFKIAMYDAYQHPFNNRIRYLREDESLVLRGIEHSIHGHLGPNGSRPTPKSYRGIGRRANTAHTHSAGIIDGIYTAGVLGRLDMGYNKGPSSWSHSNIVTYPNGKRAIVTQRRNKWRASVKV